MTSALDMCFIRYQQNVCPTVPMTHSFGKYPFSHTFSKYLRGQSDRIPMTCVLGYMTYLMVPTGRTCLLVKHIRDVETGNQVYA